MLLKDVNVVEWSGDIASQFSARLLVDMGASAIMLEPPGGAQLRQRNPFWDFHDSEDAGNDHAGALFDFLNAGKTCREIDPGTAEGVADLLDVMNGAAILVESGLDAAFAWSGVSVEILRRRFPELVVLSISPHGLDSERTFPSNDFLLQHRSGLTQAMARPVSDPATQPPLATADHEAPLAVGVCGALSAVWGLLVAEAGNRPPRIDLVSLEFYTGLLGGDLLQWSGGERSFGRARLDGEGFSAAGGVSWLLPSADGHFMVSPRQQHQWERWIKVLGDPEWADDAKLCGTVETRMAHWNELLELMTGWSTLQEAHVVAEQAQAAGVACFPVSSPAQLLTNVQLLHREFFDHLPGPEGILIPVPGLPVRIRTTDGQSLTRNRVLRRPATSDTAT